MTDQPGYLGYWNGNGLIVGIHADWPMYPCPPAPLHCLFDLAQYPRGTAFAGVDDIDGVWLLRPANKMNEPWREDGYHVAVWHEELIDAHRRGLISGVVPATEGEWRAAQVRPLLDAAEQTGGEISIRLADGREVNIMADLHRLAEIDEEFEDDFERRQAEVFVLLTADMPITINDKGWEFVEASMAVELRNIGELGPVSILMEHGFYDTAVREMGVRLEDCLRETLPTSSRSYGQALVNEAMRYLRAEELLVESHAKTLHGRLRRAMAFVRNEYAHKSVDISRSQAASLVAHMHSILAEIHEVFS